MQFHISICICYVMKYVLVGLTLRRLTIHVYIHRTTDLLCTVSDHTQILCHVLINSSITVCLTRMSLGYTVSAELILTFTVDSARQLEESRVTVNFI